MENLMMVKPTDRYSELRRRVDQLEIENPVAAASREQAESLRLVIERLEALERIVTRPSNF